jgi:hypothetical protein
MSHQKLTAKFPTEAARRFESVAAVCARWQRRYKRMGMGVMKKGAGAKRANAVRRAS